MEMSDAPNAPLYWSPFDWVNVGPRLKSLRQDFITCAVCLNGNEGPARGLLGIYTGVTVYGCVKWGHQINRDRYKGTYYYYRYLYPLSPTSGEASGSGDEFDLGAAGDQNKTNLRDLTYRGLGANYTTGDWIHAINRNREVAK